MRPDDHRIADMIRLIQAACGIGDKIVRYAEAREHIHGKHDLLYAIRLLCDFVEMLSPFHGDDRNALKRADDELALMPGD